MGSNPSKIAFEICVVTGDYQGDPLGPGVVLIMFDDKGNQSPLINLEHLFQNENDFTQARFTIDLQEWSRPRTFAKLHHIEFWRTNAPVTDLDWYLDRVIIRDRRSGLTGEWEYFFFPVHDWIHPDGQYVIHNAETWLPKYAPYPQVRNAEIAHRMETFNFFQRAKGLPVELESVPPTEIFSYDQKWELEPTIQDLIRRAKLTTEYTSLSPWDSMETLGGIYKKYNITQPTGVQLWMMNDICFGAQRIRGCNPFVIQRCIELPDCFLSVAETLKPYLEGWSLRTLMQARRLYMVDFRIMKGLSCADNRFMCAPIALFVYTEKRQLIPLAMKMNSSDDPDEPVILARVGCNLWLQAKLWFNMVDACNHMIAQRLLNHLVLESIYASMRRNMAQSNPIYQLLAPHFRSFLIVNRKFKAWVFEDGWISRCCQLSLKGIRVLLKRAFKYWTFDVNANFYRELQSRGVYDATNGLANYPYREDATLVYTAFERFCTAYLRLFYR
ncbi:hypothetical protein Ciccas_007614 [Cichlidogyrus casuarinus]|uniref:Arachidonate 5-lipoxygenase n=1 Tax=Cichlidogyrus casuarinus TaxID=1844966 RepID=A0ABD2Q2F9_9PLAT